MRERLTRSSKPHNRIEYVNKEFLDGHVSRTVSAFAERLDAGASSQLRQETCNNIYHVIEGAGETVISRGDNAVEHTILEWRQGDTFCIPSWYRFEHFASNDDAAFLFNYNDLSALEKLGFYKSAY